VLSWCWVGKRVIRYGVRHLGAERSHDGLVVACV
jgi:hypothetical protein